MRLCGPFLKRRKALFSPSVGIRRSFGNRTTRRVVLPKPGPPSAFVHETLEEEDLSGIALENREVEVQVAACAVAYRDLIDRSGGFPFMNEPTVLGHEFSGRVTKVGANSSLEVGDRVVSLHWAQYDGSAWPAPFDHPRAGCPPKLERCPP